PRRNRVAVGRPERRQGLEDHQIEGALENIRLVGFSIRHTNGVWRHSIWMSNEFRSGYGLSLSGLSFRSPPSSCHPEHANADFTGAAVRNGYPTGTGEPYEIHP